MSNMSYVRFENTLNDLRDCREHLDGKLGESEATARVNLLSLCASMLDSIGYDIDFDQIEITIRDFAFDQQAMGLINERD